LEYAADLLNRVVEGIDGLRTGIHVCRGNWSRKEDVLLSGDYAPLLPAFGRMRVDQLVLEFATPRAGDLRVIGEALSDREIGLGVVNPRTEEVESVASIVERAEEAMAFFPPERIFLNPDCGFGCFSRRCVNDEETAAAKLARIAEAARILRARHG
jgi:5-methyltetrahydropteroyltriglutamate--homocysteine methyltransferase